MEFTAQEKDFIVKIVSNLNVNVANAEAALVVELSRSVIDKLTKVEAAKD